MLISHSLLLFKEYDEATNKFKPAELLYDYPLNAEGISDDILNRYSLKNYFEHIDTLLAGENNQFLEDISDDSLFELRRYILPGDKTILENGTIFDENIGLLTHTTEPLWLSYDEPACGDLRFLATAAAVRETLEESFSPKYLLMADTPDGKVTLARTFSDRDFTKDDIDTYVSNILSEPPYSGTSCVLELLQTRYPESVVLFTDDGTELPGSKCYWDKNIRDTTPFAVCPDEDTMIWKHRPN